MQNQKETQLFKWQQKYAEFSLEKFQIKKINDMTIQDNQTQYQQISFSEDGINFILNENNIGTVFYGNEQVLKTSLETYIQENEEIQGIQNQTFNNFTLLAIITNKQRLLFFQLFKESNEGQMLNFYFEYKVQENKIIDTFYWKKNKVYFSIDKNKIYEINFVSLKENNEQDKEKSMVEDIPIVKKVIETEQEILFWECSYVTNLFYIKQQDKILIMNGVNSILYEINKDDINFDLISLKAFRQNLKITPLTEDNFLNYNYCLKDLIIILNKESKVQVLDVGKMKNKDDEQIRISEFDIYKKLGLPDFAEYKNITISSDNKYLIMNNKKFSHLVIFKINELFSTAQNHDKDFKNVFPFFEQIACITYPQDTQQIGFQIQQGDKVIIQQMQQKKELKDVFVALYQTSSGLKLSVVPLDIVFQLQEEYEENNVSKIELDELSMIEYDIDKQNQNQNQKNQNQKKQKVLKELQEQLPENKHTQKQQYNLQDNQYQKKQSYREKNNDKSNKQEKKLVISNPIDYLENTNKKKAKIERKLQQHKSNSIKMQEIKDGTSKVSNTQKKDDFDDLFDNLQLQKKQDVNIQFDENTEKQIKDIVKDFEHNLRIQLEQKIKQHKLQFNKDFGQAYHVFLDQFQNQYQKEFQENNEQILFPLIEQSFKTIFEKHTLQLNEAYLDYQKKIETTISMQNNLKYNLENVFSKREKNNKKLLKALDSNFKTLEQLQIKKSSDEFLMQNMKKTIEELQENQAMLLEQIEEISIYVHELENKLTQNSQQGNIKNNTQQILSN